jgi:RHS repeat-associated protein
VNVPVLLAPTLNRTVVTSIGSAVAFLYSGSNPVQANVTATIVPQRVSVLQGSVTDTQGNPLPGVAVVVADHAEFGSTNTRADGHFDVVVNGGGSLTLSFYLDGYLPLERSMAVTWQNYVRVPPVALMSHDAQATAVSLSSGSGMQVARASKVTDTFGTRQATLVVAAGTTAQMILPSGQSDPLTAATVRATEYTVGPSGPAAMPAVLPATSGYTYAVALTIDEAEQAGATHVAFSTPIAFYLENFLGFTTGMHVPSGYYDHPTHRWLPSQDGRVVQVLSIENGAATLDVDGAGQPATDAELAALGITTAELNQVALLYTVGQSLWRAPVAHFSDLDLNVGVGFPPDAPPPPPGGSGSGSGGGSSSGSGGSSSGSSSGGAPYGGGGNGDCQDQQQGCVVDVEAQVLGEQVPVGGTPYTLNYRSNRVPDRVDDRTLTIPLTSATPPSPLLGVSLQIDIAGQHIDRSFGPSSGQTYTYQWDGTDAYGRLVQGSQAVHVAIGYVYENTPLAPSDSPNMVQYDQEFGHYSWYGVPATTNGRQNTLWYNWDGSLGHFDESVVGLGAWSLSPHHVYDPIANKLYLGDGSWRSANTLPPVATIIPGDQGQTIYFPYAAFDGPSSVAVAPDGTVLVMESAACRLQAVAPSGAITTIAGLQNENCGYSGDGGPATAAQLGTHNSLAVGPDGSIYIGDLQYQRVRRIDPTGIITTFAGTGIVGTNVDGVLATTATLGYVGSVAVAPDGSVYIVDVAGIPGVPTRLLRVSTDGYIRVVVQSNGSSALPPSGVPLSRAYIGTNNYEAAVAVGQDGTVFLTDQDSENWGNGVGFVRTISPAGIFGTLAGNGIESDAATSVLDGQSATTVPLVPAQAIAVASDGTVLFYDEWHDLVRSVAPDGLIRTFAGNGPLGGCGTLSPGLATQICTRVSEGGIAVAPDGSAVISIPGNAAVVRVQAPVIGGVSTGFTVASADGSQVFLFDGTGRHLATRDALTGAILYSFSYDSAGRLIAVADVNGDITTISHDGSGNPTGIVSPFGQGTGLAVDSNGYLASISDALGDTYTYANSGGGLLLSTQTPRSGAYAYTYDATGRLLEDVDPAGGGATLSNTVTLAGQGNIVTRTTAAGVVSTYGTGNLASGNTQQTLTDPAGLQRTFVQGTNGTNTQVDPDGTTRSWTLGADPRFGMQSPLASSTAVVTPSGLTWTSTTATSVVLSNQSNLLSVQNATTTYAVNGNIWTAVFNGAALTQSVTSPVGRKVVTTLDAAGRPVQIAVPNTNPIALVYDAHGRLVSTTQGTQTLSQTYDGFGYLASATDALGNVMSYVNDAVGRATQQRFPDSRLLASGYDADSNLTSLTLPSDNTHDLAYTPVDLLASYSPPSLGAGTWSTQYAYDLDRRPTLVTLPDGVTIASSYDTAGRLVSRTTPQGQTSMAYNANTGTLSFMQAPSGETTNYSYDGFLRTGVAWSGPVSGTLLLGYDNDFRVSSQAVNSVVLPFGYDADGLMTLAGAMTMSHDPSNGRLTGTVLGSITDAYTYDSNGVFASYVASYAGMPIYSETVARDANRRITQKTEVIGATMHVWGYAYDVNGRLTDVTEDGQFASHYGYDADDNRTTFTSVAGTINPTYDAQDRLLTYGSTSFAYTANGELLSRTSSSGTTSYAYDPFGNLLSVAPSTASPVAYIVDGENRRVGKQVNGTLTQGYLYKDALNVVVQLDGSGDTVNRFVFGSKPNVPDYFTNSSGTFRILSDHLGSPRLIVNVASGAVAEEIDYDEFGNVTNDTSPGLTTFGFAGGLYDKDTGLVRFGARDYDPIIGRWTSKDPIRFVGGLNLYGYGTNDPVDRVDPQGTKDLLLCLQTVPFGNLRELAACLLAPQSGQPPYRTTPEDCDQIWNDAWAACIGNGGSWSKCLDAANAAEAACRKRNGEPEPNNQCSVPPVLPPLPLPLLVP